MSIWPASERLSADEPEIEEAKLQFACLMYCNPEFFDRLTPEKQQEFDRDTGAYDKELERSGKFLGANALQSATAAVTVRVRDGKMSATDGPFAETKEHLCGFVLIEAGSREEAIRIASASPFAKHGSVEVRPIYDVPGR
jgi:hypothetical protein